MFLRGALNYNNIHIWILIDGCRAFLDSYFIETKKRIITNADEYEYIHSRLEWKCCLDERYPRDNNQSGIKMTFYLCDSSEQTVRYYIMHFRTKYWTLLRNRVIFSLLFLIKIIYDEPCIIIILGLCNQTLWPMIVIVYIVYWLSHFINICLLITFRLEIFINTYVCVCVWHLI